MPLQNRVDPLGAIHAVAARGMFTGNRGVIHDPAPRTLLNRSWTSKAWLICALAYKERPSRDVMGRNAPGGRAGWTELFFLDEITALAAGHRPCFFCRREAAREFRARFAEAPDDGSTASKRITAPAIDGILHSERLASGAVARGLGPEAIRMLPDGAMLLAGDAAHAVRGGKLLPWSFLGYGEPVDLDAAGPLALITPPSTVAALSAGYRPIWHASAMP